MRKKKTSKRLQRPAMKPWLVFVYALDKTKRISKMKYMTKTKWNIANTKTDRNKKIVELREKRGMTFEKIARIMHITKARVFQVYKKEKEGA